MNMIQKTSRQPTMNYDELLISNQGGGGTPKVDQTFSNKLSIKGGRDTPLADKTCQTVFDRLPIVIISRFWFQESSTIAKVWSTQLNGGSRGFTKSGIIMVQLQVYQQQNRSRTIYTGVYLFFWFWFFLWDQSCQQGFEGPV